MFLVRRGQCSPWIKYSKVRAYSPIQRFNGNYLTVPGSCERCHHASDSYVVTVRPCITVYCMHGCKVQSSPTTAVICISSLHAYSYIQQSGHSVKTMNSKNMKKSPIHENADANITCDFVDGDISRFSSWLPPEPGRSTLNVLNYKYKYFPP